MERRPDGEKELPRLKDFFEGLQKSWEVAKKSMKMAKEAIKK